MNHKFFTAITILTAVLFTSCATAEKDDTTGPQYEKYRPGSRTEYVFTEDRAARRHFHYDTDEPALENVESYFRLKCYIDEENVGYADPENGDRTHLFDRLVFENGAVIYYELDDDGSAFIDDFVSAERYDAVMKLVRENPVIFKGSKIQIIDGFFESSSVVKVRLSNGITTRLDYIASLTRVLDWFDSVSTRDAFMTKVLESGAVVKEHESSISIEPGDGYLLPTENTTASPLVSLVISTFTDMKGIRGFRNADLVGYGLAQTDEKFEPTELRILFDDYTFKGCSLSWLVSEEEPITKPDINNVEDTEEETEPESFSMIYMLSLPSEDTENMFRDIWSFSGDVRLLLIDDTTEIQKRLMKHISRDPKLKAIEYRLFDIHDFFMRHTNIYL